MDEFANQCILITGAGGNLGGATARAFAARGANLALTDRHRESLEPLEAELGDGVNCATFVADVLDSNAVQTMVAGVIERFGAIDVLANIAGGFTMGPTIQETPDRDWDFMLDLNTRSVFHCARAVLPGMVARQSGRIINVAARAARQGVAGMGPYCVSKAAVITLTETLSAENRNVGINVNCILPGTIDTPQNRAAMPKADPTSWVPPEALADVVLFLSSQASRAISGAAIPVFGRS